MKKILFAALLVVLLVSVGSAGCIDSEPIVGDWLVYGTDIPDRKSTRLNSSHL